MPKLVFLGTPPFAQTSLQALVEAGFDIPLVVSQPDKPAGRGHQLQAPAVKEYALSQGIEVFQPTKMKSPETWARLAALEPDFFVVVAYGRILPPEMLQVPQQGCINLHASLLPQYRGASPIQFALMQGEGTTGNSTMLMDAGLDTGAILLQEEMPILPEDDLASLSERLAQAGAGLLIKTLLHFDRIPPLAQVEALASHSRLLTKEDRVVQWDWPSQKIYNWFRAFSPKPGMTTRFQGAGLAVKAMTPVLGQGTPGTILQISDQGMQVAAGQGAMLITQLQPESKSPMAAQDWARGHQVQPGMQLGGR